METNTTKITIMIDEEGGRNLFGDIGPPSGRFLRTDRAIMPF